MNLYAILGSAIIASAATWQVQGWRYGEQIAAMQKEAAEATTKAVQDERAKAQAAQAKKDEALNAANIRSQKNAALARELDGDIDRLRAEAAATERSLSQASREAILKYATTCRAVFEDLAAEGAGISRSADGHSSDSLMLDKAWPE